MDMKLLHQKFCKETFGPTGVIEKFEPVYGEDFNFAYDVIDAIAKEEPARRAMVWCNVAGEKRTFTFGEMADYASRAARLFLDHGIRRGDRVMLVLKRHYQFWPAILGLHKIGAIAIPATHLLTAKDYLYRFGSAGVSAIVASAEDGTPAHIEEAMASYPGLKPRFIVRGEKEGWLNFDRLAEETEPLAERLPTKVTDTMLLYFTSGTTGYPKMVCHDFSYPIAHIVTAKYWHNVDPDGLHLTVSETGWAKSVWGKLYGQWFLAAGIFVYDFDKFIPADLLEKIEEYRLTTFCAPPTIYRFLIKEGLERYDLSSLQYVTTAGEALNPEVFKQFEQKTGLRIHEAYGQTETTVLMGNFVGAPVEKVGSLGKAGPLYDVDIVGEDGQPLPPGEVGEIVVRTPDGVHPIGMFQKYYEGGGENAARTEDVWHDGLYHTCDTAWKDEDGFFWYVGRTDDVIKSSGYRIGPFEIESVLMELPQVLECGVSGVPDPIRGQVVKATIVLAKGYEPSDGLAKEIQNYVKKQTAPYKYPRIVEFVDELPKTISGKIRRVELRQTGKTKVE
mgnify:FL=1